MGHKITFTNYEKQHIRNFILYKIKQKKRKWDKKSEGNMGLNESEYKNLCNGRRLGKICFGNRILKASTDFKAVGPTINYFAKNLKIS